VSTRAVTPSKTPVSSRFLAPPTGWRAPRAAPADPAAVLLTIDRAGEDHPRGIEICMRFMSTPAAAKPLSIAASRVHQTAGSAGLRGVCAGNFNHDPAFVRTLVIELASELAPTLGEYRPIKSALLGDPLACVCERASGRPRHAPHIQCFNGDQAMALSDLVGQAVDKVQPNAGLAPAYAGDLIERSLVTTRTATLVGRSVSPGRFLASRAALQAPEAFRLARRKPWASIDPAGGRSHACHDADIETDRSAGVCQWRDIPVLATERDMPPIDISNHRQVLDRPAKLARQSAANPSEFWNTHLSPATIQPANRNLAVGRTGLNSKGLTSSLALKPWVSGHPCEEAAEGSVKVAKRLLQNVRMGFLQPRKLPLGLREFGVLSGPCHIPSPHTPRSPALFQCGVPNKARASSPLLKGSGLVACGIEAISICPNGRHEHMFAQAPDGTGDQGEK
jgi:hypothetical protein